MAQFDPNAAHAVEPAVGNRRVVVAYSPRLIDRLNPGDLQRLKELGFPIPVDQGSAQIAGEACGAQAKGGDGQEHKTDRKEGDPPTGQGDEDGRPGLWPGGEGSNQLLETAEDWVMEKGPEQSHWVEADYAEKDMWESAHDAFVQLRSIEMEARKFLQEELEIASEEGGTGEAEHVLDLKGWMRDLEQWLVQHDAIGQLRDGFHWLWRGASVKG